MTEEYRRCPHCKGTGICRHCRGTGRLALQKGKQCTSCYPHGSGKCQNCRGLGGFNQSGQPAAPPGAAEAAEEVMPVEAPKPAEEPSALEAAAPADDAIPAEKTAPALSPKAARAGKAPGKKAARKKESA